MIRAQNLDFSNPVIRSRYSKHYNVSGIVNLFDYVGYEIFDDWKINEDVLSSLEKLNCFYPANFHYLKNTYGLIIIAKSERSPEQKVVSVPLVFEALLDLDKKFHCTKQTALRFGRKEYSLDRPSVMGILNVTPDSFSDGGKYNDIRTAMLRVQEMVNDGADIIDVGGESTRPGSDPVSIDEELGRVIPVITDIKLRFPETLISIDTYKSQVAEEALRAGAVIVNDISGGTFDEEILRVVSNFNAAYVIMHTLGKPKSMQEKISYTNVIAEVYRFLYTQSEKAKAFGIEQIIIDPGIGFGKTIDNNYEILSRIDEFKYLGYPILIGASRKSFIGKSLDIEVNDRDIASIMIDMFSVTKGAQIIRTHNTKYGSQLKKICQLLHV